MSDGRELLASPYAVYGAVFGTPFPLIDDDESAFDPAWTLFGTNGTRNYTEAGVVVALDQTLSPWFSAGATRAINSFRTQEAGSVGFTLGDMSIDQFAYVLDNAAIATVSASSGVAGQKSISLDRGPNAFKYALLARGLSPETDIETPQFAQFQVVRAVQSANASLTYAKTPTELAVQFDILDGLSGGVSCEYIAGTAPAL